MFNYFDTDQECDKQMSDR